jgi:hypothetical protein
MFVCNKAVGDRCMPALLINGQTNYRSHYLNFLECMHAVKLNFRRIICVLKCITVSVACVPRGQHGLGYTHTKQTLVSI